MDDGLKQRIIGALVLIALVVIFVPVFFDRDRITPMDRTTRIPLQPVVEPIEISEPEPIAKEQPVLEPKEVFIPDETKPQTMIEEAPAIGSEGVPLSWVLQIASFSESKRATELRDKLIDDGYNAYTKDVKTNKGAMVRVYVGPKLNKKSLIDQKKVIDKKYNLSAIILKFSA